MKALYDITEHDFSIFLNKREIFWLLRGEEQHGELLSIGDQGVLEQKSFLKLLITPSTRMLEEKYQRSKCEQKDFVPENLLVEWGGSSHDDPIVITLNKSFAEENLDLELLKDTGGIFFRYSGGNKIYIYSDAGHVSDEANLLTFTAHENVWRAKYQKPD